MKPDPQGVTAVLIDPQGRVCASASDFDGGGSAGVSKKEAQTWRVRGRVSVDYIVAACNGYVAEAIRAGYPGAERLVENLVREHGFRLHYIEHGYPTDKQ